MAHLRDAKTSELIAEGTPTELVTIAEKLGMKAGVVGIDQTAAQLGLDLIYDDVGLAFDPKAVLAQRDEQLDALKTASGATVTKDPEMRKTIVASYKAAVAEKADAMAAAATAKKALDAARAQIS